MTADMVQVEGRYMGTNGLWVFKDNGQGVEVETGRTRQDVIDMGPAELDGATVFEEVVLWVPVAHAEKDGVVVLDD